MTALPYTGDHSHSYTPPQLTLYTVTPYTPTPQTLAIHTHPQASCTCVDDGHLQ